jgi:hypothetical protein
VRYAALVLALFLSGCGGSPDSRAATEHGPAWHGIGDVVGIVPAGGGPLYLIKIALPSGDPRDAHPDGSAPGLVCVVVSDVGLEHFHGPTGLSDCPCTIWALETAAWATLASPIRWKRAYTDATATDWTVVPADEAVQPMPAIELYGVAADGSSVNLSQWW